MSFCRGYRENETSENIRNTLTAFLGKIVSQKLYDKSFKH